MLGGQWINIGQSRMNACTHLLGTNNKSKSEGIHILDSIQHIPTESLYSHIHIQHDSHLFQQKTYILAYI